MSVRQAGRLLGVSGGDIHHAVGAKQVTMARIRAWQAEPPGWLVSARARKQRVAARRQRRADDRRLCPAAAAQLLGVPYRQVARAMRAACETQPLTTRMARGFLSGREEMPAWMSALLAASAV